MRDDDVFEAIKARVVQGRPNDWSTGELPGRSLDFAIAEAGWTIGFALPGLLSRIYVEIADGGVGPLWIAPGDPTMTLRKGVDGRPYTRLTGNREYALAEQGAVRYSAPPPQRR